MLRFRSELNIHKRGSSYAMFGITLQEPHAELTIGMNVQVSERLVAVLMSRAGIRGLPGPAKVKRLHGIATADDLVHRKFHRLSPNELWITDITEHPTREGKIYCCAVMDTFSRKIVGWSIDYA